MTEITEKLVDRHRGEILEMVVRKSPYSIKTLAKKLGISRTTLYNKFKEYNLDYDFLLLVSNILHYDISGELPELDTRMVLPINQHTQKTRVIEKQYMELLERYKRLFGFLTKVTHKYGLQRVRKQVDIIVEKHIL
ncbi:MAG: helix-turn-helix domain-containing protein [Candidatus Amoebophilus sp.]